MQMGKYNDFVSKDGPNFALGIGDLKGQLREMIYFSIDFDKYTRMFYRRFKKVFLIETGLLTNDHVIKYCMYCSS